MYLSCPDRYQGKIGHATLATIVIVAGLNSSIFLHAHTRPHDTTMNSNINTTFAAMIIRAFHLVLIMHLECLRGLQIPPASPHGHGNMLAIHAGYSSTTGSLPLLKASLQGQDTAQDLWTMDGRITDPVATKSTQQYPIAKLKR